MLLHLRVSNYALIRSLEVDFARGLNIITGETGAGKSILLGALGLLTGKRADTAALVGDEKCVIEGEFEIQENLAAYFAAEDLDFQNPCIIRRELAMGGKSRAFVNDTPVNIKVLQELSTHLVDIHSQHEVFALSDPDFRLSVCDAFGESEGDAEKFATLYAEWMLQKEKQQIHRQACEQLKNESDYLSFRLEELEAASLSEGEEEELDAELKTLANAEEIKSSLYGASEMLENSEDNVLSVLARVWSLVQKVSNFHPNLPEYTTRLESVNIELKDIAAEISDVLSRVEFNPERLQFVGDRLALINKLKKTHGAENISELLALAASLREKLDSILLSDEKLQQIEREIIQKEAELAKLGDVLRKKRQKGAEKLQKQIAEHLLRLDMSYARFSVSVEPLEEYSRRGADRVVFLFSANPGSAPQDIKKIASGGEMSRVMLAIKTVIARLRKLPMLVFDEIDTGISGKTADLAGEMMRELAKDAQIMAITHLPQIASKGNAHYKVQKEVKNGHTETRIRELSMEERIDEIARMLSGDKILPEAVNNAKALLGDI